MTLRRTRTYKLFRGSKQRALNISTSLVLVVSGLGGALPALIGQTAFAANPTNEYVSTTGNDSGTCNSSKMPCQTITYALGKAVSGTTIHVGAGTFTEALNVNQSVVIVGTGTTQTFIKAPASLSNEAAVVAVNGSTVSADVSKLTVEGSGVAGCGSVMSGIYVEGGAYANLHDLSVNNIEDVQSDFGCQDGRAILIGWGHGWGPANTTGSATVNDVTVTNYQKAGVEVSNAGSAATIENNNVTGVGSTPLIAANGIEVTYGASANVHGNTVTGNVYTGNDVATGILLFQVGTGTVVKSNTVTGNQIGLDTDTESSLPNISINGVSGNTREAVANVGGWTAPSVVYVDSSLSATADSNGNDIVTLNGGSHVWLYDVFPTLQAAKAAVAPNGTVKVPNGKNGFVKYHAPTVPKGGKPNGSTVNTNDFYFTWKAAKGFGPLTYEYQASMNPAETGGVLTTGVWDNIANGNAEQKNLTSPTIHSTGAPNGVWYWQVRTIDVYGGMSAWSPIWTTTINA